MIIKHKFIIFLIFVSLVVTSCVPEPIETDIGGVVLGKLQVDLDLNETLTRSSEAPVGNLITDAVLNLLNKDEVIKSKIKTFFNQEDNDEFKVDFAIINAGSIRLSEAVFPNGIVPEGDFTSGILKEILPFASPIYVVEVNGAQLKSIFEHSVAKVDGNAGQFLQVSKNIIVTFDKSKVAEVLNTDNTAVVTKGERVVSIEVNGSAIDDLGKYYVAMSEYLAVENGDKFLTFNEIENNSKLKLENTFKDAVSEYFITQGFIKPEIEGRIIYLGE